MAAGGLHISISAEKLFSIGSLNFTNSMLTSVIVSGLLILFALLVRASLRNTNRPTGLQNFAEWIVESLTGLIQSVTNDTKRTQKFFPFIATFFLFILLNNWIGLVPGVGSFGFYESEAGNEHAQFAQSPIEAKSAQFQVHASTPTDEHIVQSDDAGHTSPVKEQTHSESSEHSEQGQAAAEEHAEATGHKVFVPYFRAGTADLNTTLALGMFSIVLVQFFGISYLSLGYFKKFINLSNPINAFVGFLEIISEFSRIISFAFRLFGNVFAGEVLLAVIGFLVPVVVPMPFYGLEIFVGFIQALVFAMLSTVFFNMATIGHDDH